MALIPNHAAAPRLGSTLGYVDTNGDDFTQNGTIAPIPAGSVYVNPDGEAEDCAMGGADASR